MMQRDWQEIEDALNRHGCAIAPGVLDAETCAALAAQYDAAQLFRSRVVMERHGFGRGEYQSRFCATPWGSFSMTRTKLRVELS